jgi:hypothetical protein
MNPAPAAAPRYHVCERKSKLAADPTRSDLWLFLASAAIEAFTASHQHR